MGVLSDKQIRQRCTLPKHRFMLTKLMDMHAAANFKAEVGFWPTIGEQSFWGTDEQWDRATQLLREQGIAPIVTPISAHEKAIYQPMIEPFEASQVRHVERNGTFEEEQWVRGRMQAGLAVTEEEFIYAFDLLPGTKVRIDPILGIQVLEKVISYGTSSYGYDVRCADEFKIFTNVNSVQVDPKNFDPKSFVDFKGPVCIIPPNSFALARTVEYFRIPRDLLTICLGKSTYARCGIIVNVTPFEPEWEGHVTLEFSNTTPLPAKIYANEGCAQILFAKGDEICEVSYKDRGGKYQGQTGITLPKT